MPNYNSITCPNCVGLGIGSGQGFELKVDAKSRPVSRCRICNGTGRQIICYSCYKICSATPTGSCGSCSSLLTDECGHLALTKAVDSVMKCMKCNKVFKIKPIQCEHVVISKDKYGFFCMSCMARLVEDIENNGASESIEATK